MAERPSPALVKFVRRALRNEPGLSFEQLEERWKAQPGRAGDSAAEALRAVYEHEIQVWRPPVSRPRHPHHTRIVLLSTLAWIVVHLLLLVAIAVPTYQTCQRPQISTDLFGGCGIEFGLTALLIGWVQPFYGVVIALIVQRRQTAVAQGIFIAIGATTLLFTVLCFGGAAGA